MSDLPYHDQWQLHSTLNISDSGGVIPFSGTFVAGFLDSDYQASSLLANGIEHEFITFSDRYIKLEEQGESSAPMERVRYSTETVAKDDSSFGEYIGERYAVKATDLSANAQNLLDKVQQSGGSLTIHTDDENFESYERTLENLQSTPDKNDNVDDLRHSGCNRGIYIQYEGEGYVFSSEPLRY